MKCLIFFKIKNALCKWYKSCLSNSVTAEYGFETKTKAWKVAVFAEQGGKKMKSYKELSISDVNKTLLLLGIW